MFSQKKTNNHSLPSAKILICLALIMTTTHLVGKKISSAQDWNNERYVQSLPDESFAVVDRTPDGTVIRLLPHHDAQGNLVVDRLMECINQIFALPPHYRTIAREHLLQDYYDLVIPKLMSPKKPNL